MEEEPGATGEELMLSGVLEAEREGGHDVQSCCSGPETRNDFCGCDGDQAILRAGHVDDLARRRTQVPGRL